MTKAELPLTSLAEEPGSGKAAAARKMPGEEGIWFFILGDMMVFAAFFVTYLYYRADDPVLFNAAQGQLTAAYGLINTLLLLTSSWFVAQGVSAVRRGQLPLARKLITGGFALGAGFVGIKVIEYSEKFSAGITVLTNDFFMFYFMYTGIHLLHVFIGLGVLFFLLSLARKENAAEQIGSFESGAAFWHLVDLLWIILFALLYLVK